MSYKRQELLTLLEHLSSPLVSLWDPCCSTFQLFVLSYCVSWHSEFLVIMFCTISAYKRCSVRLYFQFFVWGFMSYLHYLCLFEHSGVQHVWCWVFVFVFVVWCTLCCQFLWLHLRYSLTFITSSSTMYWLDIWIVLRMWCVLIVISFRQNSSICFFILLSLYTMKFVELYIWMYIVIDFKLLWQLNRPINNVKRVHTGLHSEYVNTIMQNSY